MHSKKRSDRAGRPGVDRSPAPEGSGKPRVRKAAAVLVLLAALAAGAAGQDSGVRVLSLPEALRIAADQNKDIQKAKEFRKKVLGRYVEERAAALPQLTLSSNASKAGDESQKAFGGGFFEDFPVSSTTYTAGAGVTQALYTWGQVGAAIRAAKEGVADAEDQLRIYQQAVARDVSSNFYGILLAKEVYALAQRDLDLKTNHLEDTRKRYESGTATDYDVLAAEVTVDNARPETIRADNMIRNARERLRFLLGLEGQSVDVMGQLEAPVDAYPRYEDALAVALRNRPELMEMEHQQGIARELIKIYGAGNKPRLDFQGGAGYHHMTVGNGNAGGLAYTAGLYLTFPVFDGGRTAGKLIQARSDLDTLGIERSRLADSIALQVRQGTDAVREAGEIVQASSSTVGQAERLLFMANKGFEYGVKTHLEVLDAQHNLLQAKFNLSRARHDYLVSRSTLDWITGTIATVP